MVFISHPALRVKRFKIWKSALQKGVGMGQHGWIIKMFKNVRNHSQTWLDMKKSNVYPFQNNSSVHKSSAIAPPTIWGYTNWLYLWSNTCVNENQLAALRKGKNKLQKVATLKSYTNVWDMSILIFSWEHFYLAVLSCTRLNKAIFGCNWLYQVVLSLF